MRTKLPAASDRSYPVRKDRIHNQKQPVFVDVAYHLNNFSGVSNSLGLSNIIKLSHKNLPHFKFISIILPKNDGDFNRYDGDRLSHSISNIHGVLFKINCQIQKEDSWSYLQQKQGCEKTFIFSQRLLKSITEHSQLKTH